MPGVFRVDSTQPITYLDNAGSPVSGYRIRFTILTLNEGHEVNVPSLDPATVDRAIRKVIDERNALSKLGA